MTFRCFFLFQIYKILFCPNIISYTRMQQNILRQAIYPKNYNSKLIQYKLSLKQKFKQKNNPVLKPSESRFYSKLNPNSYTYRICHQTHVDNKNHLKNNSSAFFNSNMINIQKATLLQKPPSPKAASNNKSRLKLNRAYTQNYENNQNNSKIQILSMRNIDYDSYQQNKFFRSTNGKTKQKNFENRDYEQVGFKKRRSFSAIYCIKSPTKKRQQRKISFHSKNQAFSYKEGWNTFNNQQQQFQYF